MHSIRVYREKKTKEKNYFFHVGVKFYLLCWRRLNLLFVVTHTYPYPSYIRTRRRAVRQAHGHAERERELLQILYTNKNVCFHIYSVNTLYTVHISSSTNTPSDIHLLYTQIVYGRTKKKKTKQQRSEFTEKKENRV